MLQVAMLKAEVKLTTYAVLKYFSKNCFSVKYVFKKKKTLYQIPHLISLLLVPSLVSWDCNIHQLHLCKEVRHECPGYDSKQSDGEVPVMLELWRIRSGGT